MIEIKNLRKTYGSLVAIDNLSLDIGEGQIFGFIGPNGAGKSTTMKILATLIRADSGSARVCGQSVATGGDAVRRLIGYMPDFLGVYDDLTVSEYLQFFASAYGVARAKRMATVDACLELTDLTSKKHSMVESLSRGMQQRLGVARVLLHDPRVLLLDEPASGLDPRARIEMRSLLTELRGMGKTLMVSSHILSELGEMSDSIGIIEQGRLIYSGTMQDALSRVRKGERLRLTLVGDGSNAERVVQALTGVEGVTRAWVSEARVNIDLDESGPPDHDIIDRVHAADARIARFDRETVRLEDAFLRLTTGLVQ